MSGNGTDLYTEGDGTVTLTSGLIELSTSPDDYDPECPTSLSVNAIPSAYEVCQDYGLDVDDYYLNHQFISGVNVSDIQKSLKDSSSTPTKLNDDTTYKSSPQGDLIVTFYGKDFSFQKDAVNKLIVEAEENNSE